MEKKKSETTDKKSENSNTPEITEKMAKIEIEGQEFELEAELAKDDKILKTVLQPHFSSVENANITREVRAGRLHVKIVKKAQHKGGFEQENQVKAMTPFEILCDEPEKINPAILLAEELMRKELSEVFNLEDIEKVQETLFYSRQEIERVETQFKAIVKTKPKAGSRIPIGF